MRYLACLLLAGCLHTPERLTLRDPAGNLLAEANPQTGEIVLTWAGLNALQPKLVLGPQRMK